MSLKAGPPDKMFGKRLFTANLQGPDHQLLLAVLIIVALSAAVWPKQVGEERVLFQLTLPSVLDWESMRVLRHQLAIKEMPPGQSNAASAPIQAPYSQMCRVDHQD